MKLRVHDNSTNRIIGYEFLNSSMFGGYYHIDLRELEDGQEIGELICHTYMIKPEKLGTLTRDLHVGNDFYVNDIVLYREKEYTIAFNGLYSYLVDLTDMFKAESWVQLYKEVLDELVPTNKRTKEVFYGTSIPVPNN